TVHGTLVDAVECADLSAHWDAGPLLGRVAEAGALISAARRREPDRRLPLVLRPAVASQLVAGLGWLLLGTTAASTNGLPRAPVGLGPPPVPAPRALDSRPGPPGPRPAARGGGGGPPGAPVLLGAGGRAAGLPPPPAQRARRGRPPHRRGRPGGRFHPAGAR